MTESGALGRRITACIEAAQRNDYEAALVHFFPALDKTAKRRRPKAKVGERIRSFIGDQEDIISVIATGNMIKNISMDGITFPDAIYKFGRTAISHEGELDPRLQITNSGTLAIGKVWSLPASYIGAMCVGVMVAPENAHESATLDGTFKILGKDWDISSLWGAEKELRVRNRSPI